MVNLSDKSFIWCICISLALVVVILLVLYYVIPIENNEVIYEEHDKKEIIGWQTETWNITTDKKDKMLYITCGMFECFNLDIGCLTYNIPLENFQVQHKDDIIIYGNTIQYNIHRNIPELYVPYMYETKNISDELYDYMSTDYIECKLYHNVVYYSINRNVYCSCYNTTNITQYFTENYYVSLMDDDDWNYKIFYSHDYDYSAEFNKYFNNFIDDYLYYTYNDFNYQINEWKPDDLK